MNVLAFDTCLDACSVAAGRGLRGLAPSIAARFEPMNVGHAERLLPMVDAVLEETGLEATQLDRIAITVGPGTFTGTRIAVAAGRAFALATGAPLVTVTSLKLMAMNYRAAAYGADVLAVTSDARRGEVYFERFDPSSLASLAPAAALAVADAAASLRGIQAVVVGSGAEAVRSAALDQNLLVACGDLLPDALDLLFAAMSLPVQRSAHPLYLRAPDAKPPASPAIARSMS